MNLNNAAQMNDDVFEGEVVDQTVAHTYNDEPQVILTVRLRPRLNNAANVDGGPEDRPADECEVTITFPEDNQARLAMAVRDLERLGFDGDDISRLHPDAPDFYSLIGKQVHVRRKVLAGREYWNLAWPRRPVDVEGLRAQAAALKDKIAAAKLRAKGKGAGRQGANPAAARDDQAGVKG
jgi:hypothetical protein